MKIIIICAVAALLLLAVWCSVRSRLRYKRDFLRAKNSADSLIAAPQTATISFVTQKRECVAYRRENPEYNGGQFLDFIYVAGTRYCDIAAANSLRVGDEIFTVREASNVYDFNAIRLNTAAGRKIGYIPRRFNVAPAAMMARGFRIIVRVVSVHISSEAPVVRAEIFCAKEVAPSDIR